MSDISYGGVTKSWRAQTKQCKTKAIQPWLELYDGYEDIKFKFSITLRQGEWTWNVWYSRNRPLQSSWKYHVGYSDGVLLGKGPSPTEYYLHFVVKGEWYHVLPPWDQRIPFELVISSSTRGPYVLMILTGVSHPAFVFYRQKTGAEYTWIKQDCTIADPHSSHKSERNGFMHFTNAIGYNGKFFALSLQGTLAVIEDVDSQPRITALSSKRVVPSVSSRHFRECLLESDGEILLVFLISRKSVNIVDDIELFRLDIGTLSWIKMERIGDKALFLGSNCCMSVTAVEEDEFSESRNSSSSCSKSESSSNADMELLKEKAKSLAISAPISHAQHISKSVLTFPAMHNCCISNTPNA